MDDTADTSLSATETRNSIADVWGIARHSSEKDVGRSALISARQHGGALGAISL